MASDELTRKLQRRNLINEGEVDCPTEGVGSNRSNSNNNLEEVSWNELSSKLNRREKINDGVLVPENNVRAFNPYTEFHEFSRKQLQMYMKFFKDNDYDRDSFINFEDLKRMMEKLNCPQTHLALKAMIKEIDEDQDGKINLREFLMIFRRASQGDFSEDSGLQQLFEHVTEIDVHEEGVGGAKGFFEAKINQQNKGSKFEEEIRAEQEERRIAAEQKKQSKDAFKSKAAIFKTS